MTTPESQRRALKKHQKKLIGLHFFFNKEKESDVEILEKFDDIAMRFPNKKAAFIHLVENEKE